MKRQESGQMMMIAVMILLVLVIGIPIVVYLNSANTTFGFQTQKRQKAAFAVQEGTAYAMHALSADPTGDTWWVGALAVPPLCPFSATPYQGSNGGFFTIKCSSASQKYEVEVLVQGGAVEPGAVTPTFTRAMKSYFSAKTIAAVLSTDVRAPAALVMGQVPSIVDNDKLLVHWGPVLSYASAQWTLPPGTMDAYKYPRKFAVGDITGPAGVDRSKGAGAPNSDGVEYWANADLGFQSHIAVDTYRATADNTRIFLGAIGSVYPVVVSSLSYATTPVTIAPVTSGSGHFSVGTDTAVFDGTNSFAYGSSTSAILVEGNAQFKNIAIDLKDYGAFIVTGNLIIDDDNGGGNTIAPRIPPTALKEYAYCNNGTWGTATCSGINIPCFTDITTGLNHCSTNHLVQFRGFLYVGGNVIVIAHTPSSGEWRMSGVMRVDGQIQIPTGSQALKIEYDDEINHYILATPFDLMVDSQVAVTAQNPPP